MSAPTDARAGAFGAATYSLEELGLIGAPEDAPFRHITRLAARLLDTPTALIAVIEEAQERQLLVSGVGMPEAWERDRWVPLKRSLSQFVKQSGAPLRVDYTPDHPQLRDNVDPGDLTFDAYLGAPIFAPGGSALGALCVLDRERRPWRDDEVTALEDLARCVTDEIQLRATLLTTRRLNAELEAARERVRRFLALRQRIFDAFTAPAVEFEDRLRALLEAGCDAFGMDAGAITKIDGDRGQIIAQYWRDGRAPVAEDRDLTGGLALRVISGRDVIHSTSRGPADTSHCIGFDGTVPGACIAAPLILDDMVFGALEFVGNAPRESRWTETEISGVWIIALFVTTQLGLYGQIERLRRSESALIDYILDLRAGHESGKLG